MVRAMVMDMVTERVNREMGILRKKKQNKKTRSVNSNRLILNDGSPFVVQEAYKALRTNGIFIAWNGYKNSWSDKQ